MVKTIVEIVSARMEECTDEVAKNFHASVRPIYGSPNGLRPELIGSCLLMDVDGRKFVVTAAHVVDWTSSHALYVGGKVGKQPVQIIGEIHSTKEPLGGRGKDKYDVAFCEVSSSAEEELGSSNFIEKTRISFNKISPEGRLYMAMGYPLSRNKGKVDHVEHTIKTVLWRYSASVDEMPELASKLGVSGNNHFFLNFAKHSSTAEGARVSSINPKGISGGAFVDLGDFSSVQTFEQGSSCHGLLSGMVIERSREHHALVAVKIEYIVNAIRRKNRGF